MATEAGHTEVLLQSSKAVHSCIPVWLSGFLRREAGRTPAPGGSAGCLFHINISCLILRPAATRGIQQRSFASVSGVWKLPFAEGEGETRPPDFLISEALSGRRFNYDGYNPPCVSIEHQCGSVYAAASVCEAVGGEGGSFSIKKPVWWTRTEPCTRLPSSIQYKKKKNHVYL